MVVAVSLGCLLIVIARFVRLNLLSSDANDKRDSYLYVIGLVVNSFGFGLVDADVVPPLVAAVQVAVTGGLVAWDLRLRDRTPTA